MAMRKVGANAYLREFIPIVCFSIVFTGWKLFSAGSSESFSSSGLFLLLSCLGWKRFSAGSPDMRFGFSWNSLFSTLTFFTVFVAIPYVGWKLFSAGSPESFSAHGSLSTVSCLGCKLLESFYFCAQAAAVSSSVLGFLFMPFYCLRQGNIVGRIICFYFLLQTFSFPCATATKRPVCKSKSCESLAQTGYDSYCKLCYKKLFAALYKEKQL